MQKVRKAHIPKIPTVTCSSHLSLSINARLLSYHSNNVFFFFPCKLLTMRIKEETLKQNEQVTKNDQQTNRH